MYLLKNDTIKGHRHIAKQVKIKTGTIVLI